MAKESTMREEFLATQVKSAIKSDSRTAGSFTHVEVHDSTVILTGRASNKEQLKEIEMVVRGVPGVKDIENKMEIGIY